MEVVDFFLKMKNVLNHYLGSVKKFKHDLYRGLYTCHASPEGWTDLTTLALTRVNFTDSGEESTFDSLS